MNKQQLLRELEAMGMRPGRGLGQNFLLDGNLLESIVRLGAPLPGEEVLEVGPGFGVLTRRLLEAGARVTAVEFDHRIAEYLRGHLNSERFRLIEADACHVDYAALFPPGNAFAAIANLPYSISSIFIAIMSGLANPPQRMVFMLQREMAERLAAGSGTKAYGALSVRIQSRYLVKIEKTVPPEVFFPPPEVESAVVSFRLRGDGAATPPELLGGLVKLVFSQRRKQIGKVMASSYGRERALAALAAAGLPPEIRPEQIRVEQFEVLARQLKELK